MTRFAGWTLALLALTAVGCKSKLEKCEGVCKKINEEDIAACGGDKDCLAAAADKRTSCNSLCDTAVGSGAERREREKEERGGKSPEEADQESCDKKKDAKACINVAGRAIKATPKDYPTAAKYLEKACDLGDMFGCESFGKMLRDGKGVEKDETRARALLDKACAGNAGGACTSVGLAEGMKTAKGRELIEKGCNLGDAIGCMGVGGLYLHGTGVPKDVKKARTYLDKACKGGQSAACDKLAEIP